MTMNLIAGINADWCIDFPTPKADRLRFKWLTIGARVVLGGTTWRGLPTSLRPFPHRETIVVTRTPDLLRRTHEDMCAKYARSEGKVEFIDEAAFNGLMYSPHPTWIAGGAQIYQMAVRSPFLERLYLTHFPSRGGGSVRFPELNPQDWELECNDDCGDLENNVILPYRFQIMRRRE